MQNLGTDSRIDTVMATLMLFLVVTLAPLGCGDDASDDTTVGTARVGDPCARNADCTEGLLCKGGDLRCVRLCTLGTDECGEGIVCEPANDAEVGFCPLPPA